MDNNFLKIWFNGFEKAIESMNPEQRDCLLAPCARACSDSYPARVFSEAYEGASDRDDFFQKLQEEMKGLFIEKEEEDSVIFSYPCCYCDLYNFGYVTSPLLCACSRLSLIANFESVMGPDCVEVSLLQSILGGAESCRLRVRFLK